MRVDVGCVAYTSQIVLRFANAIRQGLGQYTPPAYNSENAQPPVRVKLHMVSDIDTPNIVRGAVNERGELTGHATTVLLKCPDAKFRARPQLLPDHIRASTPPASVRCSSSHGPFFQPRTASTTLGIWRGLRGRSPPCRRRWRWERTTRLSSWFLVWLCRGTGRSLSDRRCFGQVIKIGSSSLLVCVCNVLRHTRLAIVTRIPAIAAIIRPCLRRTKFPQIRSHSLSWSCINSVEPFKRLVVRSKPIVIG